MKVSPQGIAFIASHEGIVLGPYLDSVGVWTYGIGHTKNAGGIDPAQMTKQDTRGWSEARVNLELRAILNIFAKDIAKFEARVSKAITVPLEQHEFDALVSFDFNTGGIPRAQLTKAINAGDKSGAGFMGWLKPPEIKGRRTAEQQLFQTGKYGTKSALLYDATGTGKLVSRSVVTPARLVGVMRSANPAPPAKNRGSGGIVALVLSFLKAIGVIK